VTGHEIDANDASAHWLLGMIARSQTEHVVALEHFRRAYGKVKSGSAKCPTRI
jgi:hypothetical protein